MRLARWIGTGAALAVMAGVGIAAAPAFASAASVASVAPAASTAPADGSGEGLCLGHRIRLVASKVPEQLRSDLKAAWALGKGSERHAALQKIRKDELSGAYGAAVEHFASTRQDAWVTAWKDAPEALKTDVKALRAMQPGQERKDAATAIVDKALAGDYGDAVKTQAQRLDEECHSS